MYVYVRVYACIKINMSWITYYLNNLVIVNPVCNFDVILLYTYLKEKNRKNIKMV